jgi:Ran GTPase-activating protein (RanGAP) involved in mRNA processing and transport
LLILDISKTNLTDKGLNELYLKEIESLNISYNNIKDEGLKTLYFSLANHKNLKSLDIGSCQLTDKSIIFIKELIEKTEDRVGKQHCLGSFYFMISFINWFKKA